MAFSCAAFQDVHIYDLRTSGVTFDICNASVEHNLIFVVGRYIGVCVNKRLEISDLKRVIKV